MWECGVFNVYRKYIHMETKVGAKGHLSIHIECMKTKYPMKHEYFTNSSNETMIIEADLLYFQFESL